MKPLPLDGRTNRIEAPGLSGRRVLRLRDIHETGHPEHGDAALIHDLVDVSAARERGYRSAILIGCRFDGISGFSLVAHLDPRFGYLANGDVIAIDAGSGRL